MLPAAAARIVLTKTCRNKSIKTLLCWMLINDHGNGEKGDYAPLRMTMAMVIRKRRMRTTMRGRRISMKMVITLVPSSSRFLQLFGQPTTTVFGFMPPRPVV